MRNLAVRAGNCNHLKYVKGAWSSPPGAASPPERVPSRQAPLTNVIDAYDEFDRRKRGWVKLGLNPAA